MMNEARHQDTGRLALAIGVVAAGSAVCLATYFAVQGPFGTINDIGNAATGVLSAALAWRLRRQIAGRAAKVGRRCGDRRSGAHGGRFRPSSCRARPASSSPASCRASGSPGSGRGSWS